MFPVSDRFLNSLRLARWVPRVEYSLDAGRSWNPCTVLDGSPTADATSQVRWSIDNLVLSGVPTGRNGLTPYGGRVRVFQGMWHSRDDVEEVPLGVYRVNDTSETGLKSGRVTVTGSSLEQQVIDSRFVKPQSFVAQAAQFLLQRLITAAVPDATFQWLTDADLIVPALIEDNDRWGIVDGDSDAASIAKALAATVACDGRGVFVIAPVASLADKPVWGADAIAEPQRTLSRDGVYNCVISSGASTDQDTPPVGPGIAADMDPLSPTYVKGPFGRVPRFYSSPLLKTLYQCEKAAYSMLGQALGLQQTVTITSAPNFALEVGDVITAPTVDGGIEPNIVDTLEYPLTGGTMTPSTRATRTRLAGQVVTFEELGDVDVSDEDPGAMPDDSE